MNQFKGFEEFNFFRAINPGFHVDTAEKRPGIVVGDQDTFQGYKELYDCEFSISLELQQPMSLYAEGAERMVEHCIYTACQAV